MGKITTCVPEPCKAPGLRASSSHMQPVQGGPAVVVALLLCGGAVKATDNHFLLHCIQESENLTVALQVLTRQTRKIHRKLLEVEREIA